MLIKQNECIWNPWFRVVVTKFTSANRSPEEPPQTHSRPYNKLTRGTNEPPTDYAPSIHPFKKSLLFVPLLFYTEVLELEAGA